MKLDRLVPPATAMATLATFASAANGLIASSARVGRSSGTDIASSANLQSNNLQAGNLSEKINLHVNFREKSTKGIIRINEATSQNGSIHKENINDISIFKRSQGKHQHDSDQLAIPLINNNNNSNQSLNSSTRFISSSENNSLNDDIDERLKRRLRRNISTQFEGQGDNIGHGFGSGRASTPIVLHESLLFENGDTPNSRPKPLMMTKSPEGYYVLNNITLIVCVHLRSNINFVAFLSIYEN